MRTDLEMYEAHDAVVQPHVHAYTFTRTLVHGVEVVPHLQKYRNQCETALHCDICTVP